MDDLRAALFCPFSTHNSNADKCYIIGDDTYAMLMESKGDAVLSSRKHCLGL
jgi:hypothetical protein